MRVIFVVKKNTFSVNSVLCCFSLCLVFKLFGCDFVLPLLNDPSTHAEVVANSACVRKPMNQLWKIHEGQQMSWHCLRCTPSWDEQQQSSITTQWLRVSIVRRCDDILAERLQVVSTVCDTGCISSLEDVVNIWARARSVHGKTPGKPLKICMRRTFCAFRLLS